MLAGAASWRRPGHDNSRAVRRPVALAVLIVLADVAAMSYLSVPDTEGPLLVAAILVPLILTAALGRSAFTPMAFVAGATLTAGALVVVTWRGAAGRLSVTGWWPAKLGLLACLLASLIVLAGELRSSGQARRSR